MRPLLLQSLGDYVRLGSTLDDAVGEAFDKVARDLELPWIVDGAQSSPGAALEALAAKGACVRRQLALRARHLGRITSGDVQVTPARSCRHCRYRCAPNQVNEPTATSVSPDSKLP